MATRFRKPTLKNGYIWVMIPQVTSESSAWLIFPRWYRILSTKIITPNINDLKKHFRHRDLHGKQVENLMRLLGNYLEPRVRHPSGREQRHHCLSQDLGAILFTQKQLSPFPERLELLFRSEEILSGYEDVVSSSKEQFTTWVKTDPDVVVGVQKSVAEFREASARRHDTSSQEYRFDNNVPNRSSVRKRLSIYNWNPGPRRGREGAFQKQIAGKWHVITLQEAIEYVDRDILANRFHVTHYGGCAVLFNKDTF